MNKKAKILFFCMIFVAKGVFCQKNDEKTTQFTGIYNLKSPSYAGNWKKPEPGSVISADHYTQNFGFFCKKELQFEKVTKVPFRFRLGSVQYCDWLEGKKNTGILAAY